LSPLDDSRLAVDRLAVAPERLPVALRELVSSFEVQVDAGEELAAAHA
jgi:hypothetical protein